MPLYTVSQIANYLKVTVSADAVLSDLWIGGEVSNLSRSTAGHTYFTLKDHGAQLRCVIFRRNRGGELLKNGDAVSTHGHVSFYEARGDLQLYVDIVRPEGMGALHLELERLKVQLEEEGLFEASRKRPLPSFPHRIGVVTSDHGAVFHDICSIIERRFPLAEIVLCPALVQGNGAAQELVDAIRTLNTTGDVDIIIVTRGGGSLEELWAFNEEPVARAIYGSQSPVISAVGHETNFTIADFVADVRAPTPSSAAEMVVPDSIQLRATATSRGKAATVAMGHLLSTHRQNLSHLLQRLSSSAPEVSTQRQLVDDLTALGHTALRRLVEAQHERAFHMTRRIAALDPRAVLARGYAVITHQTTGDIVISSQAVTPGEPLAVTVSDGTFGVQVAHETHSAA